LVADSDPSVLHVAESEDLHEGFFDQQVQVVIIVIGRVGVPSDQRLSIGINIGEQRLVIDVGDDEVGVPNVIVIAEHAYEAHVAQEFNDPVRVQITMFEQDTARNYLTPREVLQKRGEHVGQR
jgi:hypothetical protein